MTKLCPRGKAAAKRKFKVYPSAYANAYASKICAGKIKDPSGVKRKDFRGKKAEGGKVSARINLKKKMKKKKMFERDGVYFDRPQPKNTFDLSNPPKRIDVAGGGLMEATARLKRQGLKKGGGACLRGMNRDAIGKNS
jgi:hypothetical protein